MLNCKLDHLFDPSSMVIHFSLSPPSTVTNADAEVVASQQTKVVVDREVATKRGNKGIKPVVRCCAFERRLPGFKTTVGSYSIYEAR